MTAFMSYDGTDLELWMLRHVSVLPSSKVRLVIRLPKLTDLYSLNFKTAFPIQRVKFLF